MTTTLNDCQNQHYGNRYYYENIRIRPYRRSLRGQNVQLEYPERRPDAERIQGSFGIGECDRADFVRHNALGNAAR